MPRFRISIRGLSLLTLALGFDSAVMVRAYQHGRMAGATRGYLLTFGLILALFNLLGLKLAFSLAALGQFPRGERLTQPASPMVILGLYLAVLLLPVLAIVFYAPGRF